jgi:hypothetical protein
MSAQSFEFSFRLGPSQPSDGTRLIARPFDSFPLGGQDYWVHAVGAPAPVRLPRARVEALMLCDAFRSASGHADAIAARHAGWRPDRTGLSRAIEALRASGLLASADEVAAELGACAPEPGAALETLFVRTCDRPDALRRLLAGLRGRLGEALADVVVVDDARTSEAVAACAGVVAEARASAPFALHHVGRADRARLAAALSERPEPAALTRYLNGAGPDAGPSHGAAVNTALLLGAGRRIALVDDDATLAAFAAPERDGDAPRFAQALRRRFRVEATDDDLRRSCPEIGDSPLDLHARMLGVSLGSLLGDNAGIGRDALLDGLDPGALTRLQRGSRVRITLNGTLGDPGTPNGLGLLYGAPEDLARLAAGGDDLEARIRTGRVASYVRAPTISTDAVLMMTTLTGIDARELLPPTLPNGRGEDLVLGVATAHAHPGSLFMDLPFMLAHRPDQPARTERGATRVAHRPDPAKVVCRLIEALPDAVGGAGPGARLGQLAAAFGELGDAAPEQVHALILREAVDVRAGLVAAMRAGLEALPSSGTAAQAVAAAIEAQQAFDAEDRAHCRALIEPVQAFARFSAGALDDWVQAWRAADGASLSELLREAAT